MSHIIHVFITVDFINNEPNRDPIYYKQNMDIYENLKLDAL